ncbi:MAG: protein translocase subunit SecA [Planctomycetota bacterium]|nr:MAG: protein translocase subunit SecA [Planctomycetota bacterium]
MALAKLLKAVFGDRNERVLKDLWPLVEKVNALEESTKALSAEELKAKTAEFRERHAQGESVDDLLPEAFAVVRETSWRTLGQRPYDVQMLGGIVLHQGNIAEMATGEGKTLTAVAPAYLNAIAGPVFLVTVNDYLAQRDCEWMRPVYESLGMTSGFIRSQMDGAERKAAYDCDITFGTNNEFGFDYLRDNMKSRAEEQVQARLHFAIIDEVDSILVDEARTPLIISGFPEGSNQITGAADKVARQLKEGSDFEIKEKERACVLSEEGIDRAQVMAGVDSFYDAEHMEWPHALEQALRAHNLYRRDKEYVVHQGEQGPEIVIVDEFTGRLMPGRRWSDGLHQAVEAKEGLRVREELQTLATITFQNYFRLYDKIAGMTGTALTEAAEFSKIYDLDVVSVPTNKPIVRDDANDVVYRTVNEKWNAIADECEEVTKSGQPMLVGTTSIESSELLAGILKRRGVKHEVLNAKHHAREADIVVQAGRKGSVTVATNMAGRGTDIMLGGNPEGLLRAHMALHPDDDAEAVLARFQEQCEAEKNDVMAAGGLYVLGTERHESRRIDNQLRGRSGRQGDPGVSRFFLSLEDDLMRIFAREWVSGLLEKLGMKEGQEIESRLVTRQIERAQKRVEARNFEIRKNLLEYDEVMDTQRRTIYGKRQEVLLGEDLRSVIIDMCSAIAAEQVHSRWPAKGEPEAAELEALASELSTRFATPFEVGEFPVSASPEAADEVVEFVMQRLEERYDARREELGVERLHMLERFLLLNTLDTRWKDHLRAMDALKQGIGLRGYGQVDPKTEYKREGYDKFQLLLSAVAEEVTNLFFRLEVKTEEEERLEARLAARSEQVAAQPAPSAAQRPLPQAAVAMQRGRARAADAASTQGPPAPIQRAAQRVGRNDPCPCGSGKKYKRCCYPKYEQ